VTARRDRPCAAANSATDRPWRTPSTNYALSASLHDSRPRAGNSSSASTIHVPPFLSDDNDTPKAAPAPSTTRPTAQHRRRGRPRGDPASTEKNAAHLAPPINQTRYRARVLTPLGHATSRTSSLPPSSTRKRLPGRDRLPNLPQILSEEIPFVLVVVDVG